MILDQELEDPLSDHQNEVDCNQIYPLELFPISLLNYIRAKFIDKILFVQDCKIMAQVSSPLSLHQIYCWMTKMEGIYRIFQLEGLELQPNNLLAQWSGKFFHLQIFWTLNQNIKSLTLKLIYSMLQLSLCNSNLAQVWRPNCVNRTYFNEFNILFLKINKLRTCLELIFLFLKLISHETSCFLSSFQIKQSLCLRLKRSTWHHFVKWN